MKQLIVVAGLLAGLTASRASVITQINDISDTVEDVTIAWDASGLGSDSAFASNVSPNSFVEATPFRQDQYKSTQSDALSIAIESPFQSPVWLEVRFSGPITAPDATFTYSGYSSQPQSVTMDADGLGLEFHLDPPAKGANVPDSGSAVCLAGLALGMVVASRKLCPRTR